MARRKAYLYIRVSRGRTHRRKLEIAEQRALCRIFARGRGYRIIEEFIEIEYSKGSDALDSRLELRQCMNMALRDNAPVLVANLNRLGRNVNFLAALAQSGVTFIITAVESEISPIILGPLERCSLRTTNRIESVAVDRQSMATKNGAAKDFAAIAAIGRTVRTQEARKFALSILPEIHPAQGVGKTTLRAIAAELNRRGIPTARNSEWTPTAVRRVLDLVGREP